MLRNHETVPSDAVRKPMNLVFLVDVSGSMYTADKLPLVQNAINMLAPELNQTDLQDSYRQEFAELIKYIR